jgi:hypothetical protein
MDTKRICTVLMVASLLTPAVALAELPAPENFTVDTVSIPGALVFDWDNVEGAVKYSVDVEGTVTYWDELLLAEAQAEVGLSFGTSDRTDGGLMGDSNLTVAVEDIAAAIAAQLGILPEDVMSLDGCAAVKALAPGKGAGSQNNPFSEPSCGVLDF